MTKTVEQVLIEAKAKIDTPQKWVKQAFATDESLESVDSTSKTACRFCSVGAVRSIIGDRWQYSHVADNHDDSKLYEKAHIMLNRAARQLHPRSNIIDLNDDDHTTHEQIMEVWDLAIQMAKDVK